MKLNCIYLLIASCILLFKMDSPSLWIHSRWSYFMYVWTYFFSKNMLLFKIMNLTIVYFSNIAYQWYRKSLELMMCLRICLFSVKVTDFCIWGFSNVCIYFIFSQSVTMFSQFPTNSQTSVPSLQRRAYSSQPLSKNGYDKILIFF